MPVKKPAALLNSHDSTESKKEREEAEGALIPSGRLSRRAPVRLKGHKTASAIWKRTIKLYYSVRGNIVTAFDEDMLVKYCLLEEECEWLEGLRSRVDGQLTDLDRLINKKPNPENAEQIKNHINLLEQHNAVLARLQGVDARLDGKRKLIHAVAQSLYLTPRSRAGVAPPMKEKEQKDPIEDLL